MKYKLEYLSLLRRFNEHGYPLDMPIDGMTDRQYFAIRELVDDGYLKGEISSATREGTIKRDILGVTGTLKGRLFQDQLEDEIYRRTVRGRLRALVPIFIAILVGAVGASVGKVVDHFLKAPVAESRKLDGEKDREAPKEAIKKP